MPSAPCSEFKMEKYLPFPTQILIQMPFLTQCYLKESVASGTNHHRHHPSRNLPKKSRGPNLPIHPRIGKKKTLPKSDQRVSGPRRHSRLVSFQTSPKVAEPGWRLVQLIWWILVRHPLIDWNFERNPGGFRPNNLSNSWLFNTQD